MREQDSPTYAFGFAFVVGSTAVAIILTMVYRFICVWENKRRDATGILEGYDGAFEDDLTDKKVSGEPRPALPPSFAPFLSPKTVFLSVGCGILALQTNVYVITEPSISICPLKKCVASRCAVE